MPVTDYELLLREPTTDLDGNELTADWVQVGDTPLAGAEVYVFMPEAMAGGEAFTLTIQQADDASGTNAETVPIGSPGAFAALTAAGFYQWPLQSTRPYLRYRAQVTGDLGAVEVGVKLAKKAMVP